MKGGKGGWVRSKDMVLGWLYNRTLDQPTPKLSSPHITLAGEEETVDPTPLLATPVRLKFKYEAPALCFGNLPPFFLLSPCRFYLWQECTCEWLVHGHCDLPLFELVWATVAEHFMCHIWNWFASFPSRCVVFSDSPNACTYNQKWLKHSRV